MQPVLSLLVALPVLALAPLAQGTPERSTRTGESASPALPGPLAAEGGLLAQATGLEGVGSAIVDDVPLLVGPAFRALFESDRVVYHPALGESCPKTQHLEFRFESIELGGERLVTGGAIEPTLDDVTVTYARGSVLERYEARLDGLEQTFVFTETLPAVGDLVVRGRLDSSLELSNAERADGGLEFIHPTYGGITLGGVTGVSADGKTAAGELRFDGEFVEYVLPRSFLEHAKYPLVLDPLIGTWTTLSLNQGIGRQNPDVAFGSVNDIYLAVWGTTYSLSDIDVHARRLDYNGAPYGNVIVVRYVFGSVAGIPKVGYVPVSDSFVIAWSEGALLGSRDVRTATYTESLGTPSPSALVAGGPSNQTEPDVGGEHILQFGASAAYVTWRDGDGGVWVTTVDPQGASAPAVGGGVEVLFGPNLRYPTISQSGGGPGRYLIAAQRFFSTPAPGDFDLEWVVVNFALGIEAGPTAFGLIGVNEEFPAVDGNGTQFVLTWQTDEPGDWDVRFRSISSAGAMGPARDVLTGDILDQTKPSIAYTGNKWVIAHEHDPASGGNVQISELCDSGLALCDTATSLLPNSLVRHTPAMASNWSSTTNDVTDRGMLLWRQGTSPTSIVGRPFDGTVGGPVDNLGGGCGDTVNVSVLGPPALNSSTFGFHLDIPGGATFAIMNARFTPMVPYACGGCQIQADLGIVLSTTVVGGQADFFTPIPGDPLLEGRWITSQFFVFPTASSPCPLFSNASASDRIRIRILN